MVGCLVRRLDGMTRKARDDTAPCHAYSPRLLTTALSGMHVCRDGDSRSPPHSHLFAPYAPRYNPTDSLIATVGTLTTSYLRSGGTRVPTTTAALLSST